MKKIFHVLPTILKKMHMHLSLVVEDCYFFNLMSTILLNCCIFCDSSKSIESALVDEDHLLEPFRWGSIFTQTPFTQTPRKFDAVFHSVKYVN